MMLTVRLFIFGIQLVCLIAVIFAMGMAIYYQIKADRLFKKAMYHAAESERLMAAARGAVSHNLVYPVSDWRKGGE